MAGAVAFFSPTKLERVSAADLFPASWLRSRPIESRVTGLRWAPFVPATASEHDAGATRGEPLNVLKHREGLVEVLVGEPREAVAALEQASFANQPDVWSDLSAAYYEAAIRHKAPDFLADAFTAADRSLAIEPNHVEALFNRALILERLALRADAAAAWSRYLTLDPGSGWADEARKHLTACSPERPFIEVLDADYDRIGRDPAAAAALYAHDPFGARGQGVVEVLGRWGHAMQRGDERDAARHLNVARQLGLVVGRGGDRMLQRAVEAIDRAGDRHLLAAAHADFHTGMKTFQKPSPADAEPLLRRAAEEFRQAGSPMAFPASLWAEDSVYEEGRRDDAEKAIEKLLATTPAEFPAYRAFMLWQLANCRNARGEWGAAITLFEKSAALFETIGEPGNVANVRRILAAIYDKIGDPETAWKNRLASLAGQGIRANEINERTVWSIVQAAIVRSDWHVASSFLNVYVDVVRRLKNDVELANALLLRSVVRDRLDDPSGVQEGIAEARLVASRVDDSSYRAMLRVAEWRSEAMLRSTPPATAEALLTRAVDYESATSNPSALPGLLLLRARARRAARNPAGALDDVEQGILQMEQHRESLPPGVERWGAFHPAEELFDEGVDLAMSARDDAKAFRITEEARGRSLLDSYGASPDVDLRALPPKTVVVEYATLPASLVIFVADGTGVHAVTTEGARESLTAGVAAFTDALRHDESAESARLAASLYKRLVDPIASRIAGATTVVFVPDGVTSTVPFSALVDARGEYLVQHHAIVVAPSTSAFLVANERRRRMAFPRTALVITGSNGNATEASLPFAGVEVDRILKSYRVGIRIDQDASQFDELTERAPDADVIHFTGHAVGDARGFEPASIVLASRGEDRRVSVAEIARLHLERTAVVVLAGCGTARGQRRAAEGVISVANGFLLAGVPSAVATLWAISDESAARFFPRLHEKLASGMSPAEALRQVQLDAIRRGDIPASLWAAIQDIGS